MMDRIPIFLGFWAIKQNTKILETDDPGNQPALRSPGIFQNSSNHPYAPGKGNREGMGRRKKARERETVPILQLLVLPVCYHSIYRLILLL